MIAAPSVAVSGACGPLAVTVRAADDALAAVIESYFALFSMPWEHLTREVDVRVVREEARGRARGTFISAAHMSVDLQPGGYFADTQYGFTATGTCGAGRDEWMVTVPDGTVFDEPQIGDIEDIFSLICTAGWREEGFVPIHGGAIVKDGVCALLCASSGGGKSTLTTAMVLSGWSTLGDDKILLRHEPSGPTVYSLLQTFNLDPATRRWFDLGELEALPRYSAWTNKRRVPLNALRMDAAAAVARPTHIVSVGRDRTQTGIRAHELDRTQTAAALLRQIVLPTDADASHGILRDVMKLVASVRGVHVVIGQDAYLAPNWLEDMERALR